MTAVIETRGLGKRYRRVRALSDCIAEEIA
jgi:hypothetical protein